MAEQAPPLQLYLALGTALKLMEPVGDWWPCVMLYQGTMASLGQVSAAPAHQPTSFKALKQGILGAAKRGEDLTRLGL